MEPKENMINLAFFNSLFIAIFACFFGVFFSLGSLFSPLSVGARAPNFFRSANIFISFFFHYYFVVESLFDKVACGGGLMVYVVVDVGKSSVDVTQSEVMYKYSSGNCTYALFQYFS